MRGIITSLLGKRVWGAKAPVGGLRDRTKGRAWLRASLEQVRYKFSTGSDECQMCWVDTSNNCYHHRSDSLSFFLLDVHSNCCRHGKVKILYASHYSHLGKTELVLNLHWICTELMVHLYYMIRERAGSFMRWKNFIPGSYRMFLQV